MFLFLPLFSVEFVNHHLHDEPHHYKTEEGKILRIRKSKVHNLSILIGKKENRSNITTILSIQCIPFSNRNILLTSFTNRSSLVPNASYLFAISEKIYN